MSNPGDTPPPTSQEEDAPREKVTPEQDRTVKMLGLWEAARAGLQARLEGDLEDKELTASFYDTAVGFLRDSGITAQTALEAKDNLEALRQAEIVASIVAITEDNDDYTPPSPEKTKPGEGTAEVVPLNAPFTPRPPR